MAEVQHIVREASCADVSDLRTSTSHTLTSSCPRAAMHTHGLHMNGQNGARRGHEAFYNIWRHLVTWLKKAIRVLSSQFTQRDPGVVNIHTSPCVSVFRHVCWHASIEVAADGMNHTAILPYHPHAL